MIRSGRRRKSAIRGGSRVRLDDVEYQLRGFTGMQAEVVAA